MFSFKLLKPRHKLIKFFLFFLQTRNPSSNVRAGKSLSENEIVDSLPADSTEKNGRLWDMALESASNFMGTHNLQFKLPAETTVNMARAIEEGRGKLKKIAGPLMLAVGAKLLALVPIFLGGLALLAVKALVVAKIAFVLAAVLGFQKFAGGSGGGLNFLSKASGAGQQSYGAPAGGSAQGWSSGNGVASAQYPYARSYDAQDLAYSAQAPSTQ